MIVQIQTDKNTELVTVSPKVTVSYGSQGLEWLSIFRDVSYEQTVTNRNSSVETVTPTVTPTSKSPVLTKNESFSSSKNCSELASEVRAKSKSFWESRKADISPETAIAAPVIDWAEVERIRAMQDALTAKLGESYLRAYCKAVDEIKITWGFTNPKKSHVVYREIERCTLELLCMRNEIDFDALPIPIDSERSTRISVDPKSEPQNHGLVETVVSVMGIPITEPQSLSFEFELTS
jgi:hypothetical protein